MKTSEFIEKAKECGQVIETNEKIRIEFGGLQMADVLKVSFGRFYIYEYCPPELAHLIIDYANTPLAEREEEKKYYLKLNINEDYFCDTYLNLNLDLDTKKYIMYENSQSSWRKNMFTQKEIDDMPFDTDFFTKVEVE